MKFNTEERDFLLYALSKCLESNESYLKRKNRMIGVEDTINKQIIFIKNLMDRIRYED